MGEYLRKSGHFGESRGVHKGQERRRQRCVTDEEKVAQM